MYKDGTIFSTNNSTSSSQTSRSISDKPDLKVWWDWWGQASGTPAKNEIDYYNVDIYPQNDVNSAYSISETQHYTQNTQISLFTLCRNYGIRVGGTLYCWVNTCLKSGAWLRKSLFRFNYNDKRWFNKI